MESINLLYHACMTGNIRKVRRILSRSAVNINSPLNEIPTEPKGSTILHAVVKQTNKKLEEGVAYQIVQLLLDRNADMNLVNDKDETPLLCAVESASIEMVKLLCNHYAKISRISLKTISPVEQAFIFNKFEMVEILLSNPNLFADHRNLMLKITSWTRRVKNKKPIVELEKYCENYLNLVKSIIQDDVDAFNNLLEEIEDVNFGYLKCINPLYVAVFCDKFNFTKILLKRGAQACKKFSALIAITALKLKSPNIFKLLLKLNGLDLHDKYYGMSLLMLALLLNKIKIARIIIKYRVGINEKSKKILNYTPLLLAISRNNTSVIRLLLRNNADLEAKGIDGYTPLLKAIELRNSKVVGMLLKEGAALNYETNYMTPLMLSVEICDVNITNLICKYDVDINFQNVDGYTALHLAAMCNVNLSLIEMLLKYRADPNIGGKQNSMTPFLLSCAMTSNIDVIKMLLHYNANAYERDKDGYTSLHYAAFNWKISKVLKLLLENFIDLNVNELNKEGISPVHVAAITTEVSCEKLLILLENGGDINILSGYNVLVPLPESCNDHDCPVINHLNKLQLLRYKVKDSVLSMFESIVGNENERHLAEYQNEIEHLKNEVINTYPRTSLYDVLFFKKNDASKYCGNRVFQEIYLRTSKDFRNEFPNFGYLLNLHYKKGTRRRSLMNAAKKILNEAWQNKLSDYFVEEIVSHLDNNELKMFENPNFNNCHGATNFDSDRRITRRTVKRLKV